MLITLHGAGGRMPNRSRQNAMTRRTSAWTKRDRSRFMPSSLEREEERHEVGELLRRERLAERLGHHARRESRHGPRALRVEDLLHDVVRRLDLGDLREVGTDRRG